VLALPTVFLTFFSPDYLLLRKQVGLESPPAPLILCLLRFGGITLCLVGLLPPSFSRSSFFFIEGEPDARLGFIKSSHRPKSRYSEFLPPHPTSVFGRLRLLLGFFFFVFFFFFVLFFFFYFFCGGGFPGVYVMCIFWW